MDAYYYHDVDQLKKICADQALAILTGEIRSRKDRVIKLIFYFFSSITFK
jgi:hypothetical protein